jgi:hypothetical protein
MPKHVPFTALTPQEGRTTEQQASSRALALLFPIPGRPLLPLLLLLAHSPVVSASALLLLALPAAPATTTAAPAASAAATCGCAATVATRGRCSTAFHA